MSKPKEQKYANYGAISRDTWMFTGGNWSAGCVHGKEMQPFIDKYCSLISEQGKESEK